MNIPGFSAIESLYQNQSHYHHAKVSHSHSSSVLPALPTDNGIPTNPIPHCGDCGEICRRSGNGCSSLDISCANCEAGICFPLPFPW
jgi:hypothetical protein